jgi:uncharacterized protein (TIGR02217 family)
MALQITDTYAQALSNAPRSPEAFTGTYAQLLSARYDPQQRFHYAEVQVVGVPTLSLREQYFDLVFVQVLSHWTPSFKWVENVFAYEVFPFDISYNSVGVTRFNTDVIVVDSGDDQRIARWGQPLMEYDISYGVRTMEQLFALIAFFRAMRGRLYGFLYQDVTDHTSSIPVDYEARKAPAITPEDQYIATGDGVTYIFQLQKTYNTPGGSQQQIRPITKPQPGTVVIAANGVVQHNLTVDYTTGIVTFVPPVSLPSLPMLSIAWTDSSHNRLIITGSGGCFAGLVAGQKLIMSGWINPLNNCPLTNPALVTSVSTDNNTLIIDPPDGVGDPQTSATGVSMYVHPAPVPNVVLTAGFQFYVPVRFDTDRLPATLEDYGVGSAQEVKLVEIRPQDAI